MIPSNSKSYQALLKRNHYLENRHKKDRGYFKVLFSSAGLDVPEDLEDESMEDGDHVNQSSPSTENGGTLLTNVILPHQANMMLIVKRGRIHQSLMNHKH